MCKHLAATALLMVLPLPSVSAQGRPDAAPVLAPVEARIRALVLHAQPLATFGTGPDIFYGQYRTENHVFQTRQAARLHQPPVVELGPLPRGFYLQLQVLPVLPQSGGGGVQETPPGRTHPWTTVVSTYALTSGAFPPGVADSRMIVMTWEAAPGAPRGLAWRIRQVLLQYVYTVN